MFDFLFSEVWWMETIAAAALSAVCTLIVALIGIAPKLGKLKDKLEVHDNQLVEKAGLLREDHAILKESLRDNQATLTFLKEASLKDQARQELLQAQAPDAQKALDVLRLTLSRTAELDRQLREARKELQALREENARLREENSLPYSSLSQDRSGEWEPD